MEKNHNAKFAFYYLLSLVGLIFMALSAGMIIFQVINKYIFDVLEQNPGMFDSGVLKFAISAIIISAPIFYLLTWQINKSLRQGILDKDSGIRKWLTYFILFIAAVVMIGWLIATINGFLNGELTTKFILKSLTSILIAAAVFSFYFYDIKRDQVTGDKNKVIAIYFYASLTIIIAVFITSLFIVESPTQTRSRKFDVAVLDSFNNIDSAINQYYTENKKLPENLDKLKADFPYITDDTLKNKATGVKFDYKMNGKNKYELCATFLTSNKISKDLGVYDYKDRWPHDSGYQCLSQTVFTLDAEKAKNSVMPVPVTEIK